jgi:hypothetical protein
MTAMLEYARPGVRERNPIELWPVMISCWLAPLLVGLSILLGWLVSAARPFPILGMICILIGAILAAIGEVLLLAWLTLELRAGEAVGATLLRFFGLSALLLSNFPVALLCIMIATSVHTP